MKSSFLCICSFISFGNLGLAQGQLFGIVNGLLDCVTHFSTASNAHHPDTGLKIDQLLIKYGYPVQPYNVVTEDGYIITVFRIPFSPHSPLIPGRPKPPVYLNHGLTTNGLVWLIQTPGRNLGMMLADAGYDVFISNCRGTTYSQGHVSKSTKDIYYWDFSWHEMGKYDIPSVINLIVGVTGLDRMYYVGHSMGGQTLFVALSERPELNNRIITAFLLAPSVYNSHSTSIIRLLSPLAFKMQYLFNLVIGGKVDQIHQLEQFTGLPLGKLCEPTAVACGACGNVLFLLFGWDGPQMNYTSLPLSMGAFPDTTSTKSLVHSAQTMSTGIFRQFDYLTPEENMARYGMVVPPLYNISAATCPIVMQYALNDNIVTPLDIKRLASEINPSSLKLVTEVPWPLFNHYDFNFAINSTEWVYHPIIHAMSTGLFQF